MTSQFSVTFRSVRKYQYRQEINCISVFLCRVILTVGIKLPVYGAFFWAKNVARYQVKMP